MRQKKCPDCHGNGTVIARLFNASLTVICSTCEGKGEIPASRTNQPHDCQCGSTALIREGICQKCGGLSHQPNDNKYNVTRL